MLHLHASSFVLAAGVGADTLRAGPDLTRYLLVCGALIAAILLLAWGFRRLLAKAGGRAPDRRGMRIVDMLPLGGKQRLAVVRCYDRTFVLGLGDKEVNLVGELDRELVADGVQSPQRGPEFSRLLAQLLGRPLPTDAHAANGAAAQRASSATGEHA
jgi:flagellar biosynthetic protein FliO